MFSFLKTLFSASATEPTNPAIPIHVNQSASLLLPTEQLDEYARNLATHRLAQRGQPGKPLLRHLSEAAANIAHVHSVLFHDIEVAQRIVPASEWLLDNYYIIEEQITEVRVDLPERYYRQLPKLADGDYAGYPRIYALAQALIVASDGALSAERIITFVRGYQEAGQELTIGELWSVAIMLRLALVERLSVLASDMLAIRAQWRAADNITRDILKRIGRNPSAQLILPPSLHRVVGPLSPVFATRIQRLREQGEVVRPVLDWLEQRLAAQGTTVAEMVQSEINLLTSMEELVGNIVTSMRRLDALNWPDFVEELSASEAILRRDPSAIYAQMDFTTRDRYRHAVEELARHSRYSETQVATQALWLAERKGAAAPEARTGLVPSAEVAQHIGYYLVDAGRAQLEQAIDYHPPVLERVAASIEAHPNRFYIGTLTAVAGGLVSVAASYAHHYGGKRGAAAAAALSAIPASTLATSLVNHVITSIIKPRVLPKLELKYGIPTGMDTVVVVPVLLTSVEGVYEMLHHLEITALANTDPHLHFALLSDFADADSETLPEDSELLHRVVTGINDLNARYGIAGRRFYLFHRSRKWNPSQGKWMGWERKRGKLMELNQLLLTGDRSSFSTIVGAVEALSEVRYVLTLDADTELPPGAAQRLIGTLAHPLNQPQLDPATNRVVRGYGILQPRVETTMLSGNASPFARLSSGHTGVDPYTTAVSDIYQDLFGEGIFMGKGVYDLRAFTQALDGRFAENMLLSHDLIEGLYARTGLVTDVTLYDDQPSRYMASARRTHRWLRGDWQILRWLFPRVPNEQGSLVRNVLPLDARWKIFDNLRRSLEAPALLAMLYGGWTILPGRALAWTALATFVRAFPTVANFLFTIPYRPPATPWLRHIRATLRETSLNLAHLAMTTTMLPHQSRLTIDAIIRTLGRMYLTHRHLLEWQTAADAQRKLGNRLSDYWREMWPSPFFAGLVLVAAILRRKREALVALPYTAAWAASPYIAYRLSQTSVAPSAELNEEDIIYLRRAARKTWRFFTTFVGPSDNWLPPDNYQEDPKPVIAHRTSPTNMSLSLLATLAARDFGYLTTADFATRLDQQLSSMEALERYRGHFYNWYDTQSLQPLPPAYISSVDSGNLAGHLLVLKHGCLHRIDQPLAGDELRAGLADTLNLFEEAIAASAVTAHLPADFATVVQRLRAAVENPPAALSEWATITSAIAQDASYLNNIASNLPAPRPNAHDPASEGRYWATQLAESGESLSHEVRTLLPYLPYLATVPSALLGEKYPKIAALWAEVTLPPLDLSLSSSIGWCAETLPRLRHLRQALVGGLLPVAEALPVLDWLNGLSETVAAAWTACEQLASQLRDTARRCQSLLDMMHFEFLYDPGRDLFVIGYNVAEQRADNSHYDLLASESRLGSFLAVARGDVPLTHWFKLGRSRTPACGSYALLSWTGTMFEYLMPDLVMRSYPHSLLAQSNRAALCRQEQYGRERGVPWGISESAFSVRDRDLNYQYRAFGVPGLGLKRGLGNELVVAPYATMLALLVEPAAASANLRRLAPLADARFGFYEAIDYTPSRVPVGQDYLPVRSYMAHHQGMSLLALDDAVHGNPMVARFHSEPLVQAVELLLQERIPLEAPVTQPRTVEVEAIRSLRRQPTLAIPEQGIQHFDTAATPVPEAHLLSNGRYHIMLTNSGGGYSQWGDLQVTRWRPDITRDNWGTFFYIRDLRSGKFWSSALNPVGSAATGYGVTFSLDEVVYWRRDDDIETRTVVIASPHDDAEVRLVQVTNYSTRPREIEVTSYAEVVLSPPAADATAPAFSKLFVQTERVEGADALLASRRPRTAQEGQPWLVHALAVDGDVRGELEYETDRARFIGRGQSTSAPSAMSQRDVLSATVGAVLDPIISLRRHVRLAPGQRATFIYTTAIAATRDAAIALAHRYNTPAAGERARRLTSTQNAMRRRQHGLSVDEAMLYQRLASRIIYPDDALRPDPSLLARNQRGQSSLWAYGISGDYPIVVARIRDIREGELLGELLRAHEYHTSLGLQTDLVIINEYDLGYQQPLNDQLLNLLLNSTEAEVYNQRGGVFLLRADNMAEEDRILLLTAARAVLLGGSGSLAEQLERRRSLPPLPSAFLPSHPAQSAASNQHSNSQPLADATLQLQFFNGRGGFSQDGAEYVIRLEPGENTPAPWSNVITNQQFGCLVTELGVGSTWRENSRENRLTPWHNDPIADPVAEAIYLRDDEDGTLWSATPLPIRQAVAYEVRHGLGYTIYHHNSHNISHELEITTPQNEPLKRSKLTLHNNDSRAHKLTITYYADWVLGVLREDASRYVITEWDSETQALLARNPYNNEFAANIAFIATDQPVVSYTADRREFLGRRGRMGRPMGLRRSNLSGAVGAGLDPCAALQISIELPPNGEQTVNFLMGEAKDRPSALDLIATCRTAMPTISPVWQDTFARLTVETPDAAMNLLLNRWLLYQALACRIWARSAFYQGGGAYGFRDQLQDVMAMVYTAPEIAREQIVRAAHHQFKEGDVQHWWHPPTGRGVRTHISDDMLWLPYVTTFYVEATGDWGVLDETAPFLEAPELKPDQEDSYLFPQQSDEQGTIYEHCVRALERGATKGANGLPLMGSGDWNDGMNRVGNEGKGESVWLAWFLASTLEGFAAIAEQCGDEQRANWCRTRRADVVTAIEQSGWDGTWYRRAYFDDGTPLGSAQNDECQIDAIAQSWSVISGMGNPIRQQQALAALNERLIRDQDGLILLLTPPFDKTELDPGYIKGYLPGVRENGGQYTHAAIWTTLAFALHGDGKRAYELFSMLNPINHSLDEASSERYKVEPYVVAADVYSHPDHVGRGGWTWYTGSAAWLYRVGLESILGFRLQGDHFTVKPVLPPTWPGYRLTYRYRSTSYTIQIIRGDHQSITVDGAPLPSDNIPLRDDGSEHQVQVTINRI